ncbi:hypothetical protein VTK73DRAFT_2345 [Phialemonium thermophilum]|uniref:Uncharacterized protein n=1 Tax=Phialemonium thermophilum TaxID=223376 RepID=A0ABR3VSA2_9PEZI
MRRSTTCTFHSRQPQLGPASEHIYIPSEDGKEATVHSCLILAVSLGSFGTTKRDLQFPSPTRVCVSPGQSLSPGVLARRPMASRPGQYGAGLTPGTHFLIRSGSAPTAIHWRATEKNGTAYSVFSNGLTYSPRQSVTDEQKRIWWQSHNIPGTLRPKIYWVVALS